MTERENIPSVYLFSLLVFYGLFISLLVYMDYQQQSTAKTFTESWGLSLGVS